jgi:hypothetical protein
MTAKTKRPSRAPSEDTVQRTTGAAEDSGTFSRASRHREELLEEARVLRRAGKIRAARGVEGRVQQVEQLLGALEGERRPGHARATPN